MKLPDICRKTVSIRIRYLSLITYMARVDNSLDNKEIQLLESMIKQFGLGEKHTKKIMAERSYTKDEIEIEFISLREQKMHYSFFIDLISMALADNVLHDREKVMLGQIVTLLGIPREDFHLIINFAQTTGSIQTDQLIDPMYSYIIDAFFSWIKQKQVTLFKQTTLAIDHKVDSFLKQEL